MDYRTVAGYGETEIEINKSRFIAYVNRAEREEEALSFIQEIKKKHWNATHNCSAYMAGSQDQWQKADDDGEPSGTAGRPILEVIKKTTLKNSVVVVTRYFGGIKLGAGGLIRAYGKAASEGIKVAGLIERILHSVMMAEIDYSLQGTVENGLRSQGHILADVEFTDKVTFTILQKLGEEEALRRKLADWTAGQALIRHRGERYVDLPVES